MKSRGDWLKYLGQRVGTYEYRTRRYAAVADKLELMGLADGDLVVDIGAGMCEFGRYLFRDRGWTGRYLPIDGAVQGVDLNNGWAEAMEEPFADFFVAIETLEHLFNPFSYLETLAAYAVKGVAVTTPNTDVLGDEFVRTMDETHVFPLWREDLTTRRYECEELSLFGRERDTLLGWHVK